jgi:uncharacterized OsmC-like protein
MSDHLRVSMITVDGGPTAVGWAGDLPLTVIADRPVAGGGRGLGFNGGQLLYLSIAACVSNDLYREAAPLGIALRRVSIEVRGAFAGRGSASGPIDVLVDVDADADDAAIDALIAETDRVAEIPNSIRGTVPVTIRRA